MSECPKEYEAPLTDKAEILTYLKSQKHWSRRFYSNDVFPICFNVKIHTVDFSFDNLIRLCREYHFVTEAQHLDNTWLESAQKVFSEEFHAEREYDWILEDMGDGVFDCDSYHQLWDGTPLDVDFEFQGRSGGWLCLTEFEGFRIKGSTEEEWDDVEYDILLKLYRFIVQCVHDFSKAVLSKEIHYQAAYRLSTLFDEHDVQTEEEITKASIGSGI